MPDMVVIARLETRNFEFMAIGETEFSALVRMKEAWRKHAAEYPGVVPWRAVREDVTILAVRPGDAFRDGEPL